MKKKTLYILLGCIAAVVVALAITLPLTLIKPSKSEPSVPPVNEKKVSFTFSDIYYQGPRDEGGSYWELYKFDGSPTGTQEFQTKHEYVDDHWVYHSYVDGDDYDTIGSHLVTIYKDEGSDTPFAIFHFEFVVPNDVTFTKVSLFGHFYTNKELTSEVTTINYTQDKIQPLTIIESVNEYYKIVLDEIAFYYVDK